MIKKLVSRRVRFLGWLFRIERRVRRRSVMGPNIVDLDAWAFRVGDDIRGCRCSSSTSDALRAGSSMSEMVGMAKTNKHMLIQNGRSKFKVIVAPARPGPTKVTT